MWPDRQKFHNCNEIISVFEVQITAETLSE